MVFETLYTLLSNCGNGVYFRFILTIQTFHMKSTSRIVHNMHGNDGLYNDLQTWFTHAVCLYITFIRSSICSQSHTCMDSCTIYCIKNNLLHFIIYETVD